VNLALLAVVFFLFLRVQLDQELQSFLLTTARERILAVSRLIALELREQPPDAWSTLLARYSDEHGVTFYLAGQRGEVMAGPGTALPKEVMARLRAFPGFPRPPGAELYSAFFPRPFLIETDGPQHYWVGVRIPLRDPATGAPDRATLLLASATLFTNPFFVSWEPWAAIAAVAVFVSLICWLPLVRGLTHSIRQMMVATSQIAQGQFDAHVNARRRDELGSLGTSINRMAGQLESYVNGQKRFLGDVAHELRSPLARMQVALGIMERRPEPDPYVADLQEEVQAMTHLTDELLTFAKAELRPDAVPLERVNVAEVVEQAVRVEGTPEARIRVEVPPDLTVMAVRDYLLRSVANVVRNAVRYAGDAGPISVTAKREGDAVRIVVADCGPGLPESAFEKIFTPFYRVESSRDRKSGGIGLGMAIVKSCIEECKGSVSCRNRTPHGLEVRVDLQAG
jgi:two-component system sensor histidine kinase CpxA